MLRKIAQYLTSPRVQNLGVKLNTKKELGELPSLNEIVAKTSVPNWNRQINPDKFNFKVRNQNGSSSCVAFTRALIWSIMYHLKTGIWVDFSAKWPYMQRSNFPEEGMSAQDQLSKGMVPDDLLPSDNLTEAEINKNPNYPWLEELGQTFQMGTPILLPIGDIDALASTIEATGKPIQIFVRFGSGEWGQVPKTTASYLPYVHSLTVLPEYGMYKGEKAVLVQDSWGKDLGTINGKRILTESFYRRRNLFAQYWINFRFEKPKKKPSYDGSVKSLQECLKFEGIFPSNIDATGFFGSITKNAVIEFQKKYEIEPALGYVGPKTIQKLKELFN